MIQCKICKRNFDNRKGLSYHAKIVHSVQFVDYVLQFEHNNTWPTCECGCKEKVSFFGGKFMIWVKSHYHVGRPKTIQHRKNISNGQRGRKNSISSNEKRSVTLKQNYIDDPDLSKRISSSNKGKKRTREQCNKISVTRKRKIASGEIVINRDKVSQTITQMYIDGGFAWAKGSYVSKKTGVVSTFRSSWEYELMCQLDDDPDVITWESEFTSIQYEHEGKTRRYVPDFHVIRVNDKNQLIEVKPTELRDHPLNASKRMAAKRFCDERGWEYIEWEPELNDMRHHEKVSSYASTSAHSTSGTSQIPRRSPVDAGTRTNVL